MKVLEYKDVTYSINDFFLDSINFFIEEGKLIGFSGESGSGKTTLIDLIYKERAYKGDIYICSRNVREMSEKDIFNNLFILEQNTEKNLNPLCKTEDIFEEIRYIRKKSNNSWKKIVEDMISYFEVDKNILKKNIFYLSGGEKQIIGLMKAFLLNPKLLIFDESLSSLDTQRRDIVVDFTQSWIKQTNNSIIYITHNIKDLFLCDQTIFIQRGKVSMEEKENIKNKLCSIYGKETIDFFLN